MYLFILKLDFKTNRRHFRFPIFTNDFRTHRHVAPRANERVGHGIDQLTGNSKVTDFYFTSAIHQNVTWFHIAMHYRMFVTQITQTFQYLKQKKERQIKSIFL